MPSGSESCGAPTRCRQRPARERKRARRSHRGAAVLVPSCDRALPDGGALVRPAPDPGSACAALAGIHFVRDAGDWLGRQMPEPVQRIVDGTRIAVPTELPEVAPPATVTGALLRGAAQFGTGFVPAFAAARAAEAVPMVGGAL